ncbi:MAG TPA: PD-(D/E)XK nuclease domain-containing protein [Chitinispirillaceae bacterium]|nr:PD-(D/E)XK nuclease domain-containing protein [Chitinispirillaceae bacterium]
MKVPNLEILYSLNSLFFDYLTDLKLFRNTKELPAAKSILTHDFDKTKDVLSALFASIPYSNYANNIIANYEGYYASVVYTFLASIGFEIIAEDITSRGQVDLTIKTPSSIVIIEFKVDSSENALKQIKEKRYFEKYLENGKDIYLLGIHFDSEQRNISEFVYEQIQ